MERIFILDFGSQYTQLIARRLRELGVCSEVYPYNKLPELTQDVKAVVLSGSPYSVLEERALKMDLDAILGKVPVLGICYGAQYIANQLGGKVEKSSKREYGRAKLIVRSEDPLFVNVESDSQIWMSHADSITQLPEGFELNAKTEDIPIAGFRSEESMYEHPIYCVQFHPEVTHSDQGKKILENFITNIANCSRDWTPESFIESTIDDLRTKLQDDKVILGLSGGVDSSVAAALLHEAIGPNLHCIFVDTGLLRKNEYSEVLASYSELGLNVKGVDASKSFLTQLAGLTDPEEKRKTIGRVFIEVFEKESKEIEDAKWLAQGTIYPDVIESASVTGPADMIKSHHNVGGLPEKLNLKIVEPLRMLFKDEVRKVGRTLECPEAIVSRHPFPGPGLAIRILGAVTPAKVKLLQDADAIFIDNLKKSGWYDKVWQAGTILPPIQSVGVMGDERTYESTVALRAVSSVDGMTADWVHLPYELLAKISNDIINQVKGINRVVYDISSKPPATIEWE